MTEPNIEDVELAIEHRDAEGIDHPDKVGEGWDVPPKEELDPLPTPDEAELGEQSRTPEGGILEQIESEFEELGGSQ